jgi:CRISPR-associated endonuclease Cas2
MVFLVMYDISGDKCRLDVAEYLEGKGQRIQESVFECDFSIVEKDRVVADMGKILGDHPGNIRFYPVCAECRAKAAGIGDIKKSIGADGYAIF